MGYYLAVLYQISSIQRSASLQRVSKVTTKAKAMPKKIQYQNLKDNHQKFWYSRQGKNLPLFLRLLLKMMSLKSDTRFKVVNGSRFKVSCKHFISTKRMSELTIVLEK